jgi:hypothetical protein
VSIEPLLFTPTPASFTSARLHVIFLEVLAEWRNWQTQQTQNLPGITPRVGSTPSVEYHPFRSPMKTAEFFVLQGFLSISDSPTMTLDDQQ